MNMRKLLPLLLIALIVVSCEKPEDKIAKIVDQFLTQVNKQYQVYDKDLTTDNFDKFFEGKGYYTSQDWKLTVKPFDDGAHFMVEARGNSHNGWGQPMEIMQGFALTKEYGKWQIYDSFNFVEDELAFRVVDTQWDFYWDRGKYEIMDELRKKLTLEIITPGYQPYYSTSHRNGKLKLINNSDYDIEGVKILVEHFDRNGNSVNTSHSYPGGIIRKHGYREFDWLTTDCTRCYRQTYKICFEKESAYQ